MKLASGFRFVLFALVFTLGAGCGDDDAPPPTVDLGVDAGPPVEDGGDADLTVAGPCVGAADGIPCEAPSGVASICVAEACAASVCGDSVVDVRTEDCEDGNLVASDGCEPGTCTFSCVANSDCDDANECNGVETCLVTAHECQAGTALTPGAACTSAAGTAGECNAAGVCGPAGCGNGVVGTGEACDDGNTTAGDGCDNDCTYSCVANADCDDADVCNGTESCTLASHTCALGTALACADGNACQTSSCDPVAGCQYILIDADGDGQAPATLGSCGTDCDDTDPSRFFGAAELCDGIDNDCNGVVDEAAPTWYVDCDGDGYAGSLVGAVAGCTMPPAATTGCPPRSVQAWTSLRPVDNTSTDCYDGNASVYPGQTAYFTTAALGRLPAVDFDYDCSTIEETLYSTALPVFSTCRLLRTLCVGATGWTGAVPACGASGTLSVCSFDRLGVCARRTAAITQSCR
jgi:cysteine-rich repeat protein